MNNRNKILRLRIQNCFTTTGLSLVLLALLAALFQARFLLIAGVLQTFLANIIIHLGLSVLNHFESNYYFAEAAADVGYILTVLLLFGHLFGWYSSTPPWVLVLMGIVIYIISNLIGIFRIRNDVKYINRQLKLRQEQKCAPHTPAL